MATQSVIHPVPQQKSAVIPIDSPAQVIPIAKPFASGIRLANNRATGVRTFYVASQSNPGAQYVVQFIRRAGQRRGSATAVTSNSESSPGSAAASTSTNSLL